MKVFDQSIFKKRNSNVVNYHGLYEDDGNEFIVFEYVSGGSIKSFLQRRKTEIDVPLLIRIAKSAAAGMEYLESKKIVHANLACRNLLIKKEDGGFIVKVSDYGLKKSIKKIKDPEELKKFPVKWVAPEAWSGKFTYKSDVWYIFFGIIIFFQIFFFKKIGVMVLPCGKL